MDTSRSPRVPTTLRMILGIIWITGAVVNAVWTLRHASVLSDDLGSTATFAPFRWFFDDVVGNASLPWIVLLILGELGLGILLLGSHTRARLGLVLSALWSTFLTFVIWPYTLTTIPLVIVSAVLLRYEHPVSLLAMIRNG